MSARPLAARLPESLPADERVIWRARPDSLALTLGAFRAGWVAAYFGGLFAWRLASRLHDGAGLGEALGHASFMLAMGAVAVGILAILGWLAARTTLYTITDRRIVFRVGIALPMTINVPFAVIADAAVKPRARGCGDIAFGLKPEARIGYLLLWPHVRAFRFARPQPALRCVRDVEALAERIARALQASDRTIVTTEAATAPTGMPVGLATAAE